MSAGLSRPAEGGAGGRARSRPSRCGSRTRTSISWRGWPSRCSGCAPTMTAPSSSTTAWRWPSGSAPTASISARATATRARRGRCSDPRRRSAAPATTAGTWRWKRARRAATMSPSAPSTRPPPSPRTTALSRRSSSWWSSVFEIPCVAIGGITPDNAQPLLDAGADFIAVCQAVWGQDDPGAAVARFNEVFALDPLLAALRILLLCRIAEQHLRDRPRTVVHAPPGGRSPSPR